MNDEEIIKSLEDFKKRVALLKENYEKQLDELKKENEGLGKSQAELFNNYKKLEEEKDYFETASLENPKNIIEEEKKFTEEDVKNTLAKALEKSKEKINSLTSQNKEWEENYNKKTEELENLKISYKSLNSKLEEMLAPQAIDHVLNGEITGKDIDNILKEDNKSKPLTIKPAEEEINEMINGLTKPKKIVNMNV